MPVVKVVILLPYREPVSLISAMYVRYPKWRLSLNLPAMKFFLASSVTSDVNVKRQFGNAMNEFCEMSTLSSWPHSLISSGKVDIRLLDRFSSERRFAILSQKYLEPWSSGYRMRLISRRLWVRISAPDTRYTFFTLIRCKICIVCLKRPKINEKEAEDGPFLKRSVVTLLHSHPPQTYLTK